MPVVVRTAQRRNTTGRAVVKTAWTSPADGRKLARHGAAPLQSPALHSSGAAGYPRRFLCHPDSKILPSQRSHASGNPRAPGHSPLRAQSGTLEQRENPAFTPSYLYFSLTGGATRTIPQTYRSGWENSSGTRGPSGGHWEQSVPEAGVRSQRPASTPFKRTTPATLPPTIGVVRPLSTQQSHTQTIGGGVLRRDASVHRSVRKMGKRDRRDHVAQREAG